MPTKKTTRKKATAKPAETNIAANLIAALETAAPKPRKTSAVKKSAATKKIAAVRKPVSRAVKKIAGKKSKAKPSPLPESYGTGRLFLVARDPRWLYAHWDFSRDEQRALNAKAAAGHLHLRVHRDSTSGALVSETKLPADASHWFLPVARGETRYVAELGYHHARGGWVALATSDAVVTPSESIAPETSMMFATIPQDVPFKKVLESIGASVAENLPLIEIIRQFRAELPGFDVFPAERNWTPQQTRELSRIAGVKQIRRRLMRELSSLTAANVLPAETEVENEDAAGAADVEEIATPPSSWSGSWSGDLN